MDFQSLLDQATQGINSTAQVPTSPDGAYVNPVTQVSTKQADVLKATVQKQAALGGKPGIDHYQVAAGMGNNSGNATMSDVEKDLRTLNPAQLSLKYGAEAPSLLLRQAAANQQFSTDNSTIRSGGEILFDTASGVESGIAGSLGGIAAWGTGLINPEVGATFADRIDAGQQWLQDNQSEAVQAARRATRAKSSLDYRDNAATRQNEIDAGTPEIVADLSRFGRDVIDAASNADNGTMFIQGTSEGVGSLVAGVPLVKGIRALGSAATGGANAARGATVAAEFDAATGVASTLGVRATNAANKVLDFGAWPATTALMEGGGAYTGTVSEVMNMTHEQLMAGSEKYRALIAQNISQDEAKIQVASEAGQDAAMIQAPIGGVTGLLTRYAEKPFQVPSVRAGVTNALVKEPTEEAIQSSTGQVAQNLAIQENANDKRTLSEGVGEGAVTGALYGMGSAGVVQAPGTVVSGVYEGGKLLYEGGRKVIDAAISSGVSAFQATMQYADKRLAENDKASPIADTAIQEATAKVVATAPQDIQVMTDAVEATDISPEQKIEAKNYISSLVQAMQFDGNTAEEFQQYPDNIRQTLSGTKNRTEAIQKMSREVARLSGMEQLLAAGALYELMDPIKTLQESNPEALDNISVDDPVRNKLLDYQKLVANIDNTPAVLRALRSAEAMVKGETVQQMQPITESELQTPEGQAKVKGTLAIADMAPDQGNEKVVAGILLHAEEGRITLNPQQLNTLNASLSLLRARQVLEQTIAKNGLKRAQDVVSSQIVASDAPGRESYPSARQHTQKVLKAMKSGNTQFAKAYLQDFGLFVQHMTNKAKAFNQHFQNGDAFAPGIVYQALMPTSREWKASKKPVFVNMAKSNSIDVAQSSILEQNIIANVYNGLVNTFPELGEAQIKPVTLDPRLDGNPEELANVFNKGVTVAKQQSQQVVEKKAVSRISEERLNKATVKQLETSIANLETKIVNGGTAEDQATLDAVTNELKKRPVMIVEKVVEPEVITPVVEEKIVAPVTPEPVVEAVAEVIEEAPVTPVIGLQALYPNLVNTVPNMFYKAFTLNNSEVAPSLLIGQESPVQFAQEALSDSYSLDQAIGKEAQQSLTENTAKAFQTLLGIPVNVEALLDKADKTETDISKLQSVGGVLVVMDRALQTFLNKNEGKLRKAFEAGEPVNRYGVGKLLNIVEKVDGDYQFNKPLIESVALAGMSWFVNATNPLDITIERSDAASIYGIPVENVTNELLEFLRYGATKETIKDELTQKIKKYWGLSTNKDVAKAYTDGIAESAAAEFMDAMVTLGMMRVLPRPKNVDSEKTPDRYEINTDIAAPVQEYPTAIDELVLPEPEKQIYLGNELPPVAKTQMNNPSVPNTPEQLEVLNRERKTPFTLNMPMLNLYMGLGESGVRELFGAGNLENRVLNVNHVKSLEGQNRTAVAAFKSLTNTYMQMQNAADKQGIAVTDLPIRYGYNFTSVGRMQMLGAYNPQSTKFIREALLPTWSTLDLSGDNAEHSEAFDLALGQALGVKVHKIGSQATSLKVKEMMAGELAPLVQYLTEWMQENDTTLTPTEKSVTTLDAAKLKELFAATSLGKASPLAFHALTEYVRLQSGDKKAFKTGLYLEADGVTNGPFNAMNIFTIGAFDQRWLKMVGKGGMSFGNKQSLAKMTDKVDTYETNTLNTKKAIQYMKSRILSQKDASNIIPHVNAVFDLMGLLLPDVNFDPENQVLELKRGISKNPLTIFLYGSSAAGIANNITNALLDVLYERMSALAEAKDKDLQANMAEVFFPEDSQAEEKFTRLTNALNLLQAKELKFSNRDSNYYTETVKERGNHSNEPSKFTLTPREFKALQQNVKVAFIEPMTHGIAMTVGDSLIDAVETLKTATQVQSIALQGLYNQKIEEVIADKLENDPTYRKGDFLSDNDLKAIDKSLGNITPLIQTGKQNLLITKTEKVKADRFNFSRSFADNFRTPANHYAPVNAGVAGIPFMVISSGDGMMMQNLSLVRSVTGTLKIFDGMNMPLDMIKNQSLEANKSVYKTLQSNPMRDVQKTYDKFLANKDELVSLLNKEQEALSSALNENAKAKPEDYAPTLVSLAKALKLDEYDVKTVLEYVEYQAMLLKQNADQIEARHKAIARIPVSIDQMASAGAPYFTGTTAYDVPPSQEEILNMLNAFYAEELAKIQEQKTVEVKETSTVGALVKKDGVKKISWSALKKMGTALKMTSDQKIMFDQIIRSMGTKEYQVITGSADQIRQYQKENGLTGLNTLDNVHGYVSVGEKKIYLIDPTNETLVHELIHAASYEITQAYYNGEKVAPEVADAIVRMEVMMDTFMTGTINETVSPEVGKAVEDARAAIQNAQMNLHTEPAVAKAVALNEFMAWALSNEQLTKTLKETRAPKLVQLAKDVIKAIKQMIWGKKRAPKIDDSFLTNLQFNAAVLIRTQPSLSTMVSDATLFHKTDSKDHRISTIRDALNEKVNQYMDLIDPTRLPGDNISVSSEMILASEMLLQVSAVFPMNLEEQKTFEMYVLALATEAKIDPNVMNRFQELYTYVTKNLKIEDFIPDNTIDVEAARYYAAEKYNVILGKSGRKIDKQGRTTMLPVFVALATINSEFRDILFNMKLSKDIVLNDGTLDNTLENFGTKMMDSLSERLSGDSNSADVREAIDNLNTKLHEVAFDEKTYIEQIASNVGGLVDHYNNKIVGGINDLSNKGIVLADKLAEGNIIERNAGRVITLLSGIASEENGAKIAQDVISMMNESNIPKPLFDLINDLVGRTSSNAPVYDMIKQVRAMVQQLRQQFREYVPHIIAKKFSRHITDAEWATMYRGFGKTDLAVLADNKPVKDVINLFVDQSALESEINDIEELIQSADAAHWLTYQQKMKQLANFMNTGIPGNNLLRNAYAISNLFGEGKRANWKTPSKETMNLIDKLTTLYAIYAMEQSDKDSIISLVQNEPNGVEFVVDYLIGQRKGELSKVKAGNTEANYYKGHIPSTPQQGVALLVADDSEFTRLTTLGYTRVGNYTGSALDDKKGSRSYYFAPLSGKTAFSQGILQNVKHTVSGVDEAYGFTTGQIAGRITQPALVKAIAKRMSTDKTQIENLMPVYDKAGNVFAFERSLDPKMLNKLNGSQHLGQMIGVWRGRQVEEKMSQSVNERLIDNVHNMWVEDIKISSHKQKEYVNLFDVTKLDQVQLDAMGLLSDTTLDYIKEKFGDREFWVRKDMLEDVIGYRNASLGDVFTGNTRWSPETQKAIKHFMISVFGVEAYRLLVRAEQFLQNVFSDVRSLIVVKSVVVPIANFVSNMYQLISRGVPLGSIARGLPSKLNEIQSYTKSRLRQIEVEAELRAATEDPMKERKLLAEIRSITDSHRRMSIWPLIEAGEFSSIADVGMTSDDLELTTGNFTQWVEKQIDKLPAGLKTTAKYGYIARDTALFQGLQKAVQYGDFMAKAVLYDDLTQRKGLTKEQALARITEEFVNYDRLPGRDRGYLENMGMLWFYNYKIRISKIALSTIRNNPLHALLVAAAPMPGGVGLPVEDNLISKAVEGSLGYSIGPGMGIHGHMLNPWYNLVN